MTKVSDRDYLIQWDSSGQGGSAPKAHCAQLVGEFGSLQVAGLSFSFLISYWLEPSFSYLPYRCLAGAAHSVVVDFIREIWVVEGRQSDKERLEICQPAKSQSLSLYDLISE